MKKKKKKSARPRRNKGLAPLRQKAFGKAAEEFGKQVAPLGAEFGIVTTKVARSLIFGLEQSVYGLSKVGNWLRDEVAKRLRDVPPENIMEPNPRIAVPATQALVYSLNDEFIATMFANLMAADMTANRKSSAHPAFVEIIKEMTPHDAKAFSAILTSPQIRYDVGLAANDRRSGMHIHFSFEIDGIDKYTVDYCISNLTRLGLVRFEARWPIIEGYDAREEEARKLLEPMATGIANSPKAWTVFGLESQPHVDVKKEGIYATPLGIEFSKACMSRHS